MRDSIYKIESDMDADYCSYPLVPFWNNTDKTDVIKSWQINATRIFNRSVQKGQISLYIHLPFCENKCTFCSFNAYITKNHEVEKVYIQYLIKEWKLYLKLFADKPIIRQLHIGGGSPAFFSVENLRKLFDTILPTIELKPDAELTFEAQINTTSIAHLKEFSKIGFQHINIAIQDFDQRVQQAINQKQSYDDVLKITKAAKSLGYQSVRFNLLYVLHYQSRKTVIDTIYKIRELKPHRVNVSEYIHDPEKFAAQKSYEAFLPIEPERKMFLKIMQTMLTESGYVNIGMNQFVLKSDILYDSFRSKSLHYNLMGYTDKKTALSIGLGVAAISDSWYATVQNERSLKAYYHSLDKGKLPISCGYFLNYDDLLLRKHILNLQCKFKTTWGTAAADDGPALAKGIERIKIFEKQNWLKISNNSIKIKKKEGIIFAIFAVV